MADWVGAAAASLMPLVEAIRAHVFAAERLHGDDTTVPVLAKERTRIGRLWVYVRDDRPFAGPAPPAAAFFYSPDREGIHPERHLAGFAGHPAGGRLWRVQPALRARPGAGADPRGGLLGPCPKKAVRAGRDLGKAPIAAEAVRRIDRLFAVERDIAGLSAEARLAVRRERSAPILAELEPWLRQQQERLSRKSEVGKAIAYTTRRWEALTRFMSDGRICLSNNAAERALRGVAVGRRNWTFAGSDRGGERAAAIYTLIETAKLNGVDPQAWLADVLARIADHPAKRITDLLPWNWRAERLAAAVEP